MNEEAFQSRDLSHKSHQRDKQTELSLLSDTWDHYSNGQGINLDKWTEEQDFW